MAGFHLVVQLSKVVDVELGYGERDPYLTSWKRLLVKTSLPIFCMRRACSKYRASQSTPVILFFLFVL